jgi:hypothetical protein
MRAQQSSTDLSKPGSGVAALAVDGLMDLEVSLARGCTATLPSANPWLAIDLGSSRSISGMLLLSPSGRSRGPGVPGCNDGLLHWLARKE